MVDALDRRAGTEGLPGVVRLQDGDQGRSRHAHDLYRRDRRYRPRSQGPRAALLRRRLRARRAFEEGAAGGLTVASDGLGRRISAFRAILDPLCSGADWGVAKW